MTRDQLEKVIYKGSFAIVVTVVLLGIVEIGAYLVLHFYPLKGDPFPLFPADQKQPWAAKYRKDAQAEWNVEFEPYVGWKAKPYQGEAVVIDSDGTRRTFNSHCGRDAYTIWMFGGSTLWGEEAPDWETIPSLLAEDYQKHGQRVCVRNFGETAWVNTQAVIELMLELKRAARPPNLVIIYGGANEGSSLYKSGQPDAHYDLGLIRAALRRHKGRGEGFQFLAETNTYKFFYHLKSFLKGPQPHVPPPLTDSAIREQLDLGTWDNLDVLAGLARQYGFAYALFWQPVLWAEHKPLADEEKEILREANHYFPGADSLYGKMYGMARQGTRAHFYYIADLFNATKEPLYIDPWHLRPVGNRLVADRMYELLPASK